MGFSKIKYRENKTALLKSMWMIIWCTFVHSLLHWHQMGTLLVSPGMSEMKTGEHTPGD